MRSGNACFQDAYGFTCCRVPLRHEKEMIWPFEMRLNVILESAQDSIRFLGGKAAEGGHFIHHFLKKPGGRVDMLARQFSDAHNRTFPCLAIRPIYCRDRAITHPS